MSAREFKNIGEFLRFAATLPAQVTEAAEIGVELGTRMIWREAKDVLGTNPTDWPPLAEVTRDQREAQGYSADEALLKEGLLKEHISMGMEGTIGRVGVPSTIVIHEYEKEPVDIGEIAVWQELGTPDSRNPIPPRSFLARSAKKLTDRVIDGMVSHVISALSGKGVGSRSDYL